MLPSRLKTRLQAAPNHKLVFQWRRTLKFSRTLSVLTFVAWAAGPA